MAIVINTWADWSTKIDPASIDLHEPTLMPVGAVNFMTLAAAVAPVRLSDCNWTQILSGCPVVGSLIDNANKVKIFSVPLIMWSKEKFGEAFKAAKPTDINGADAFKFSNCMADFFTEILGPPGNAAAGDRDHGAPNSKLRIFMQKLDEIHELALHGFIAAANSILPEHYIHIFNVCFALSMSERHIDFAILNHGANFAYFFPLEASNRFSITQEFANTVPLSADNTVTTFYKNDIQFITVGDVYIGAFMRMLARNHAIAVAGIHEEIIVKNFRNLDLKINFNYNEAEHFYGVLRPNIQIVENYNYGAIIKDQPFFALDNEISEEDKNLRKFKKITVGALEYSVPVLFI